MRINSEESMKTLERVLYQYGSWFAMLEAATYEDGVFKVPQFVPKTSQSSSSPPSVDNASETPES